MRSIAILLTVFIQLASCKKNEAISLQPPANSNDTSSSAFTYLALGDSYTIGQNVAATENYPNQTISLLRNENIDGKVKIIATTGWTTRDLKNAINATTLDSAYDIVTLLIGVNNQYVGMPIDIYKTDFEWLIKKAIALAGNKPSHVIVLSIPDWGVTPFAGLRDKTEIAKEIDNYNEINKSMADKYGADYINITPWTREAATDLSLLAADGLHPSGKEYARWAGKLQEIISVILK